MKKKKKKKKKKKQYFYLRHKLKNITNKMFSYLV